MSEKRFVWKCDDETCHIFDTVTKARYFYEGIMNLLNEQQAIIEAKDKEIEESKITIQLYETDVSMRDNFLKSKGLYDEFLQCIWTVNE